MEKTIQEIMKELEANMRQTLRNIAVEAIHKVRMLKLKAVAEAIKDYQSEFPEHFMVELGVHSLHLRMDNLLSDLEKIGERDVEIANHMEVKEKPGGITWVKVIPPRVS